MTSILIVEARFYADISDALLAGATAALKAAGAEFDTITVPGALEIPGRDRDCAPPVTRPDAPTTATSRSAASFAARPTHFRDRRERIRARADGP